MSVTQESTQTGVLDYSDIEVQNTRTIIKSNGNNVGNNGTHKMENESALEYDPVDGLARDEVAELLGYQLILQCGPVGGNAQTDAGVAYFNWVLGVNDAPLEAVDPPGGLTGLDPDGDGGNEFSVDTGFEMDAGIIASSTMVSSRQSFDTTNGAGAGGIWDVLYVTHDYRQDHGFALGPLVDSNDKFTQSFIVDHISTDGSHEMNITGQLYWLIHDIDDPLTLIS